jgi:hypothetical protein
MLERVDQRAGDLAGNGGQALGAGTVGGVDQALQRLAWFMKQAWQAG